MCVTLRKAVAAVRLHAGVAAGRMAMTLAPMLKKHKLVRTSNPPRLIMDVSQLHFTLCAEEESNITLQSESILALDHF